MHHRFARCRAVWLLALVAMAGCGGSDPNLPPRVPVEGTVTMAGQPLSHALVTFYPVGQTRGRGGSGHTDEDGHYEAESAGHLGKGLPAGEYRVFVSKLVMPDGSPYVAEEGVSPMDSDARELVPPRYTDMDRSPLRATVPPDGGIVNLDLTADP